MSTRTVCDGCKTPIKHRGHIRISVEGVRPPPKKRRGTRLRRRRIYGACLDVCASCAKKPLPISPATMLRMHGTDDW